MIEEAPFEPDAADRRGLLEALALAFRDNPMNVRIHGPSPTRRVRANRAGLRALVLDADRRTVARVLRREGRIVGGFVATPPGRVALPAPRLRHQIVCFLQQGARAMDAWGAVNAHMLPFRPEKPHWYLAVLGVEPAMHGRGLGARLLESLLALTGPRPAPIYLESDRAESVRFYRAHGFVERAETEVHGVRCWCLGHGFDDGAAGLCDSVRQA